MRAFIVLALVAAASAGLLPPSSGYEYEVGHSTGHIVTDNVYGNARLPVNVGVSYGNTGLLGTGTTFIGNTGSLATGGTTVLGNNVLDSVPQTVEYSKQFYHFTAPEEEHHASHIQNQLSNVLKKNLQVVFVKAPENNAATNAALQLAKQAIEQRTAIYVLSKENDASQVIGQIQQIQENVQTSPEVRIIKYRTPQDIAVAKQSIQSQYENTGGSSQTFDGGVAPVLNYASNVAYNNGLQLGTGLVGGLAATNFIGTTGAGVISTGNAGINYLPSAPFKK